jgi:hypothetical protein
MGNGVSIENITVGKNSFAAAIFPSSFFTGGSFVCQNIAIGEGSVCIAGAASENTLSQLMDQFHIRQIGKLQRRNTPEAARTGYKPRDGVKAGSNPSACPEDSSSDAEGLDTPDDSDSETM